VAAGPAGAAEGELAAEDPAAMDLPGQEELLKLLKGVRKGIAQDRNLPPYIIFSDKTLRAMAKNRPTDPAALRRCPGVGDHKLEAYGSAFLRAIREFTQS
jgi:ATP-dependent DNA helicase RecQ